MKLETHPLDYEPDEITRLKIVGYARRHDISVEEAQIRLIEDGLSVLEKIGTKRDETEAQQ